MALRHAALLASLFGATCLLATASAAAFAQAEGGQSEALGEPVDRILVRGQYLSLDQVNAVKTPTPLIDVPQSLSVITIDQIEAQAFTGLDDMLRYTPGLSISQGEGHRDAIIIRGNQTTADFFLNGIRDDVEYYRPLYNLEQVEILRGANALLFGRGGGGGVINRVTKSARIDEAFASSSFGIDSFGAYQLSGDANFTVNEGSALRINALVEEFNNHRDVYGGERYAINPTATLDLTPETSLEVFFEYVNDDRVVDRGVPSVSIQGGADAPLEGFDTVFFGDPEENFTTLEARIFRASLDHAFSNMLRGNVSAQYADYDKLYQNIYPAGLDQSVAPAQVTLDGYLDTTLRENFILQGNLIAEFQTGRFGHTLLIGAEYGDQSTANGRSDTLFAATNDDQITVDLGRTITVPDFQFAVPVRDRTSQVEFTSLYIQDQIDLTDAFKLIVGARLDRFDVSVLDRQAISAADNGERARVDEKISPRLGFIYKPAENISLYASYSETFLPSAGDQFLTLSPTSEDLEPQVFENHEIGLKWDLDDSLSLTAAVFQLERGQFTSLDSNDPSIVIVVAGSVTSGVELQLSGDITERWSVSAGYSYLDGEVEGGAFDGNVTRQTPEHMASIWNSLEVNDRLELGLGVTYQDEFFVLENNAVAVPGYTRVDAAAFYDFNDQTRIQLNVENLFDTGYFPDAHSNDNITTGAPLNARVSVRHQF